MQKKVCSFIGVVAFFLLLGTAGGYEQDLITTAQFLVRCVVLFLVMWTSITLGTNNKEGI